MFSWSKFIAQIKVHHFSWGLVLVTYMSLIWESLAIWLVAGVPRVWSLWKFKLRREKEISFQIYWSRIFLNLDHFSIQIYYHFRTSFFKNRQTGSHPSLTFQIRSLSFGTRDLTAYLINIIYYKSLKNDDLEQLG